MTASLQSGKSRLKMYVYERIPDLLTTNLENISQRRMTMEIRYIERKKVRLKSSLFMVEQAKRAKPFYTLGQIIKRYYIDTRVQKLGKSDRAEFDEH